MREEVGSVFEEEIERRTAVSDDNIDGAGSIFLPHIIAEDCNGPQKLDTKKAFS
jgi:hypothetical protein